MDINETKALIRSLLISSKNSYTIKKFLIDFKEETGHDLPVYNFKNAKSFLKSLTDTVKIRPGDVLKVVNNHKTSHIASLVKRQGNMRSRCVMPSLCETDKFPELEKSDENTPDMDGNPSSIRTMTFENGIIIGENCQNSFIGENKHVIDDPPKDFIFSDKEISNLDINTSSDNKEVLDNENKSLPIVSDCKSDSYLSASAVSSSATPPLDYGKYSTSLVTDGVKKKLREIMQQQSQGIWCRDLPELFIKYHKMPLCFQEYGYRSLIEMVMELSEIFRYIKPENDDWLLYDATKPPSQEELDMNRRAHCKIPEEVQKNIMHLVETYCESTGKNWFHLVDILVLYFKMYKVRLDFSQYGFSNLSDFMNRLNGQVFKLEDDNYTKIVKPLFQRPIFRNDSVIPLQQDFELLAELFPGDVVKPGLVFNSIKLEEHFKVGQIIGVNIGDVYSPTKFYVQIKKYEECLESLMRNLQNFYNKKINELKMPEPTIQPNQICIGLYLNPDGSQEWHRTVILQVKSEDDVLASFVDYGTVVQVSKKNLRFLHRDFFDLPAQAIRAKLNVSPISGKTWPLLTSSTFLKLLKVPEFEFSVTDIDQKSAVLTGNLFTINNNKRLNVNQELVRADLAILAADEPNMKYAENKKIVSSLTEFSTDHIDLRKDVDEDVKSEASTEKLTGIENQVNQELTEEFTNKMNLLSEDCASIENKENSDCIMFYKLSKITEKLSVYKYNETLFPFEGCAKCSQSVSKQQILEKNITSLAFFILKTNDCVRNLAKTDFDAGLRSAEELAIKMINNR